MKEARESNNMEDIKLLTKDRFFYSYNFFLPVPIQKMVDNELDGAKQKPFNRHRFVAVAGREAFHVFDLELNKFVVSDYN